jgi:pimeloyl-ACP methyl ester carboxylesterase
MYCIDFITRNGELIHYLDIPAHETDAPLVILLHGFPDNAFGWDLQIEGLKGKYHLIAPFMPGTLNDRIVPDKRLALIELKSDIKEIILKVRKTSKQKIFILSHDLGSFLSVALAKEMEGSLSGLIHFNGMGIEQFVDRKWSLTQWLKSYYVILVQSTIVQYFINKVKPQYFLKRVYDLSCLSPHDEIRKNDRRVINTIALYQHLLKAAFHCLGRSTSKIAIPSLFVWGNKDAFLNIPNMNEVDKFYEKGSVRILDGGHWVMRSKHEQVNRILLKTLSSWEESI